MSHPLSHNRSIKEAGEFGLHHMRDVRTELSIGWLLSKQFFCPEVTISQGSGVSYLLLARVNVILCEPFWSWFLFCLNIGLPLMPLKQSKSNVFWDRHILSWPKNNLPILLFLTLKFWWQWIHIQYRLVYPSPVLNPRILRVHDSCQDKYSSLACIHCHNN